MRCAALREMGVYEWKICTYKGGCFSRRFLGLLMSSVFGRQRFVPHVSRSKVGRMARDLSLKGTFRRTISQTYQLLLSHTICEHVCTNVRSVQQRRMYVESLSRCNTNFSFQLISFILFINDIVFRNCAAANKRSPKGRRANRRWEDSDPRSSYPNAITLSHRPSPLLLNSTAVCIIY